MSLEPFSIAAKEKVASKGTVIRAAIAKARTYLGGAGLGPFLMRAVAGSGVVRIGAMLATFLVGVQLARQLGASGYGYYGIALSVITLCGIPGELGISRLVTREVATANARHDAPALFGVMKWADRTCWIVSAVMMIGVCVAAFVIRETDPLIAAGLLCGAPTIPFLALSRIRGGALQGLHHIVRGQIPANLLRPALFSILLVIAFVLGITVSPASAMLLGSITAATVFLIAHLWLQRELPARSGPAIAVDARKWLRSTIPFALTDGMFNLQRELSILLLGVATVPAEVGLFRIAASTAFVAVTPLAVINHVAFPTIAKLHAEQDGARLQKAVTHLARAQFAGVILLSLPLLLFPGMLLALVFGPEFARGANAMRILALGQIANAAFGPNIALLNMTHHERRVTRAMAIALAVNISAVLFAASRWGSNGTALAMVAALMCWNFLLWMDGQRLLGIDTSVLRAPMVIGRRTG